MSADDEVPPGYVRRADADALTALLKQQLALLEKGVQERIAARVQAGENAETVSNEEVRRTLAEVDKLILAFRASLTTKHS